MRAFERYKIDFSSESLRQLFEDKIITSLAVGRDGIRIEKFRDILDSEIALILRKVDNQDYNFTGYKEKLISKGPDKPPRQLSIPTIRDRLTQRAIYNLVSHIFSDCRSLPPHNYIKEISALVKRLGKGYSFVRMDIENFYPSINHDLLIRKIKKRIRKPQIVSLIRKALKTPTGKSNLRTNISSVGVPQGLCVSNLLAEIYISHIDDKYKKSLHYFRYVDDILVICKTEEAEAIFKEIAANILRTSHLKCHLLDRRKPSKSRIVDLSDGVDYLGFHINDSAVSICLSSYNRMFANLMSVFTQHKYKNNLKRTIWRLNLKITGCRIEEKRVGWV